MWDDFVKRVSNGYDWPSYTPEGIVNNYHHARKRLMRLEDRLKNPVSLKGGGSLRPTTIRQLEREKKSLIQSVAYYKKFIKTLVKKNMLPTSELISGKDRMQFIFSLWTMLELPEFGKAVYYANRLIGSRYDSFGMPSTNDDYIKWVSQMRRRERNMEERSRESMYDALIKALNETLARIKSERQRLLFSGKAWKPPENNAEDRTMKTDVKKTETEIESNKEVFARVHTLLDELADYRRCYPKPNLKKESSENKVNPSNTNLAVHKGGLYIPSERPAYLADDFISDEFKAWQRAQRAKTHHQEND